ncbi:MAG: ABC transporter ATP-binding protein [Rhodospirillales bacterium]|nr:ABC transporter ATP-binding protein [Rhodospirillales bacterium]
MVLAVDDLSVTYATPAGPAPAVRSVSLALGRGETLGIVGESGSGKSTLAHAMIGYLAPLARRTSGRVLFHGDDLLAMPGAKLAGLRGRRIAMVHQNPQATLNPALKVGTQIAEVFRHHAGLSWAEARARAVENLGRVNMPEPSAAAARYPHELSGGQRQRVVIAIALALDPDVLILDEPTTALDVTTEAVILDLLRDIKRRIGAAIVYISHNLGVIAQMADRVAVMYAGEVVEDASVESLFLRPTHPYTRALLDCLVQPGASKRTRALTAIPGAIPRLTQLPAGCIFEPRCMHRADVCLDHPDMEDASAGHRVRCVRWREIPTTPAPPAAASASAAQSPGSTLMEAKGVRKSFSEWGVAAMLGGRRVQAVAGVDMALARNRVLGLVGESGSGKTTLLRCLAGLETAEEGSLAVEGFPVPWPVRARPQSLLRRLQVVFQDPESTLNPKHTVRGNLGRHLRALLPAVRDPSPLLAQAMARVRLDPDYLDRYPAELSGGEKQRVAIARAFLGGPEVVLCDEPLSALDVSVQASIVKLLLDLQAEAHVAYLLISHDLAVVRYVADEIAVMYLGRLVELGPAETFDAAPLHPYTEALLSAVSLPIPRQPPSRIRLQGPIPSPTDPPSGCVFHTRCPRKIGTICETAMPPWREGVSGRRYCCHIEPEELRRMQVSSATSLAADAGHAPPS